MRYMEDGDLWGIWSYRTYRPVVTLNGEDLPDHGRVAPIDAARRMVQWAQENNYDATFRVVADTHRFHAPVCSWCAARPAVGEMDCDGWYWTGGCDSPQCIKTGDIRRGRRNISASNRARGF